MATIFEEWGTYRKSELTRRAYRSDAMAFISFMGGRWPDDATDLLTASPVRCFRPVMERMFARAA